MGLFGKTSHSVGRGREKNTVIDFTASHVVENAELRANLSKLFVVEDEVVSGQASGEDRHDGGTSVSKIAYEEPKRFSSSPNLDTYGKGVDSLSASAVEDLTPLSVVSPADGKYPEASQESRISADLAKWSAQSPGKRSAKTRPFQNPSVNATNRRMGIVARTNSISRLSKASKAKSAVSSSTFAAAESQREPEIQGVGITRHAPSFRESHTVENSPPAKVPVVDFSASPTTPHDELSAPARNVELLNSVPKYSLRDSLSPVVQDFQKGDENSTMHAVLSKENVSAAERSLIDLEEKEKLRKNTAGASLTPENRAVSKPSPTTAGTKKMEHTGTGCMSVSSSRHRAPGDRLGGTKYWDRLEVDDFAEVYGLEAATPQNFANRPECRDRLNTSPASDPEVSYPFVNGSDSPTKGSPSRLDPHSNKDSESKRSQTQASDAGIEVAKPKARKRPPPLVAPEPPSSKSGPETSPHTGVFSNNGDFKTGGFRITSEGMVGKPERITRKDSDDAPSLGRIPLTVGAITLVRSLGEFRKGPTLGMGAAGRVYLAIHEPSAKCMAIKVVNVYDEAKRNQLLKELETLSSHVSRFLVRFYGAFYDGKGAVHIALEFMDAGCLHSTIQQFGAIPEAVTRVIAVDCLRSLRFLHRHNVLHRDFKTANILLSRRTLCAKVSDFGLARDLDAGVSRVDTFVGTVAYMSPERLHGCKYTYASDIWALGICVVECLLGRYPFERPQSFFDYLERTAAPEEMLKGESVSTEVSDFVQQCTKTDPALRPTASNLMEHPWIKGYVRDVQVFREWMDSLAAAKTKNAATMRSIQSVRSFLGTNGLGHGHGH